MLDLIGGIIGMSAVAINLVAFVVAAQLGATRAAPVLSHA